MDHWIVWLKFAAASAIVIAAGLSLTRNAERLAAAMGWGHAFAGFVILGWATSLPEVTISLSAITAVGSAGLAAGSITGSVIFNLAILAGLELYTVRKRLAASSGSRGVFPLGVFNLVMLAGMASVCAWPEMLSGPATWGSGIFLLAGYVLATLHAYGNQGQDDQDEDADMGNRDRLPAGLRCLGAGAVILGAGLWLTQVGDELAATYDLEEGFVGTLFLASVSSLPELVTGYAAARLGLLTLAVGSILGSNIFNLGILGVADLVHQSGAGAGTPLLVSAGPDAMLRNVLAGVALTALGMLTVKLRIQGGRRRAIAVVASVMLAIYLVALGAAG